MGRAGAATVVVAQPDHGGRELLARIIEAAGQNAVRLEATDPPVVVDTTVESLALVLVLDATAIGFGDLDAIVDAFAKRRYPAKVIALVDGPASAASATAAGASVALERPFQRDDFVAAMADLLGIDVPAPAEPPPAEPSPADAVATTGDIAAEDLAVLDVVVEQTGADETVQVESASDAGLGRDDEGRSATESDADEDVDVVAEVDVPGGDDTDDDVADVAHGAEPELHDQTDDDRLDADVESEESEIESAEAIEPSTEAEDPAEHVDPVAVHDSTENESHGAADFDHEAEPVLILGEAAEPDAWDLIEAEGRVASESGGDADAADEPATGTDAAERGTMDEPDKDERAEDEQDVDEQDVDEANDFEDDDEAEDEIDAHDDDEEVDDGDKARPLGADHSFTDILRMGRQL